ncbi:hypothetical protein [Mesorhizobium sp. M1252]|uniref:hypothetical protein n=1 Tax=Mesorhizobium sp. M1252 TaxID=2957073 RepID=UPI00333A21D0
MPVKRRLAKRRTDSLAEIAAWSTAFECEFDFFHDLELFGLFSDAEVKAALPEAWKRLGHAFLVTWVPKDTRETPWALDQFGRP